MTGQIHSLRDDAVRRAAAPNRDQEQDEQLLRAYVRHGSRPAFDRPVERHRRLVYAVCRREVGDPALAEDVTQAVFLILAKKAPSLRPGTVLAGWLFGTARLASRNALRREDARRRQEDALVEQYARDAPTGPPPDAPWGEIEPLLNGALAALGRADREALLLRFFEGLTLPRPGPYCGYPRTPPGCGWAVPWSACAGIWPAKGW